MLTTNQITDQFMNPTTGIGRQPTDYEISKYSNSSIQDLANIKSYYGKLNTNQSISDYLTSIGQDPSLQNRMSLYSKYGITPDVTGNYYKSNVALLESLKSGKQPTASPITDTITKKDSTDNTDTTKTQDTTTTDTSKTDTTTTPTDPNQPPQLPVVKQTQDAYTQSQQDVLDNRKQIKDLNDALDSSLQAYRDKIARVGGVVDEAQIRGIVLAENAPLLQQRKELLNTQSDLIGQQNIAAKAYQEAVNSQKESDVNFFKEANLNVSEQKMTDQEQQFADKFTQAGWKSAKVNVTDAAGNIIGQKVIWTENPANTSSNNSDQYTTTSSGSGGISSDGTTNVGNTANLPPVSIADGASPEQVLQSLISGNPVPVKGSTTPLSQQDLYNMAVMDMLGSTSSAGGRTPSGDINAIKDKETQIMNAYGLTPFDIAAAKEEFKGFSAANTKLLASSAFIKAYTATATDNLNLAVSLSSQVPRTGAKLVNKMGEWLAGNFTPSGNLAQFETAIYTAAREYAKVTSGGAQSASGLTDSATQEAEKLINAAQSPDTFKQVVQTMQADMANVNNELAKQTSSFPSEIKALFGIAGGGFQPRGTMSDRNFVENTFATLYPDKTEEQVIKEQTPNLKEGEQLAFDNNTGAIVAATKDDISTGNYTPL